MLAHAGQGKPTYYEDNNPEYNRQELTHPRPEWVKEKDPNIALILALIPGLFGFLGIGHLYIGRIVRGIILLFSGFIIGPLIVALAFLLTMDPVVLIVVGIFWIIIWLILLIWQTMDAYQLAKTYNHILRMRGSPPW
jgi:TM2 domain-containing membrane protein YozV